MSFCTPIATRIGRAFLLSVLLTACSVFETQEAEFPDAGPNGPDSLYAGIGQGIPFGAFSLPPDQFRAPHTGAVLGVSRSVVGSVLKAARAGKLRLVLNLAGPGKNYRNPDGTLNLAVWKSRVDTYRDVDFAPYVTEGLILAHFLVDEPNARATWGGVTVSRADIAEMARYSKEIWPTLPTVVRTTPGWLLVGDTTYPSLDIAWAQWNGPRYGAGAGLTPEQFRDKSVAEAKELGVGLIFGMNYLDGGDGSSGIPGTDPERNWWQMSTAELTHVGTLLAETPYACAMLSWRYDPYFESRQDVRAALDSLATVAGTRGGTSCLRRDTTAVPDRAHRRARPRTATGRRR